MTIAILGLNSMANSSEYEQKESSISGNVIFMYHENTAVLNFTDSSAQRFFQVVGPVEHTVYLSSLTF